MSQRSIQRAMSFLLKSFTSEVLVEARNVAVTLSNFLKILKMKKRKIVAPKVTPKGAKVLHPRRYNFASVVEVTSQERPHCKGAEISKYIGHLGPTSLFTYLL